ncbi:MAG: DMT family transporter [Parachlamydiaceae bacterium]|nr:DMT family transporter [Parachlamydiaceae bacterium]
MSPIKRVLLIIALTMMWSPSFLFIKLALHDLPPLTIVSLRVTLAAIILGIVLLYLRRGFPKDLKFWFRTSMMAFLSSALPFSLFCYAEQSIDSSLAAILNGTTPMFTALLAQIFVASDKMSFQKAIGITLSGVGVILLFAPKLIEGMSGTSLGMMAAMLAAFSYSMSHVYGKLFTVGQKQFVAPAAQFMVNALMIWPFAFWYEDVWNLPMPSLLAIGGVCGLAVFGTVFAYIIYYKLLDHCGPTAISMVACFFPVVGMLLGFIFLGETFTLLGLTAAGMILLGMLIVNGVINFDAKTVREYG